jgi:hypothetical protein
VRSYLDGQRAVATAKAAVDERGRVAEGAKADQALAEQALDEHELAEQALVATPAQPSSVSATEGCARDLNATVMKPCVGCRCTPSPVQPIVRPLSRYLSNTHASLHVALSARQAPPVHKAAELESRTTTATLEASGQRLTAAGAEADRQRADLEVRRWKRAYSGWSFF